MQYPIVNITKISVSVNLTCKLLKFGVEICTEK